MKKNQTHNAPVENQGASNEQAQARQILPTEVAVRINSIRTSGNILAFASVNLNGCFAIPNVKVMNGPNGPFVSMPSYKSGNEYKDYCFPCTKEFKREFDETVLDAYHQQLSQKDGMQKDEAPTPEEAKARQGLAMTM